MSKNVRAGTTDDNKSTTHTMETTHSNKPDTITQPTITILTADPQCWWKTKSQAVSFLAQVHEVIGNYYNSLDGFIQPIFCKYNEWMQYTDQVTQYIHQLAQGPRNDYNHSLAELGQQINFCNQSRDAFQQGVIQNQELGLAHHYFRTLKAQLSDIMNTQNYAGLNCEQTGQVVSLTVGDTKICFTIQTTSEKGIGSKSVIKIVDIIIECNGEYYGCDGSAILV